MFRTTLSHTSGTLVLDQEPKGFGDTQVKIRRDPELHGLFFEFTVNINFFCNGGGREFIEDILDTLGIDENITFLSEFACNGDEFKEFITGRVNLPSAKTQEPFLRANIEQVGISQVVKNLFDVKIDLKRLTTLKGTALSAFTFGPYDVNFHSKALTFESKLDGGVFTNHHDLNGLATGVTFKAILQNPYTLALNELTSTVTNDDTTNFANQAATLTLKSIGAIPFHDSTGQSPVILPGTYNVDWRFVGDFVDQNTSGGSWTMGDFRLEIAHGPDLDNLTDIVLGTVTGYTDTSPTIVTTPFSITSGTTIDMKQGDKIWIAWNIISYRIASGGSPSNADFDFNYTESELTLNIVSVGEDSSADSFAIHEAFARIGQSITDQTDAFRSELFGRKNSQPFAYAENGCGSFTAVTVGKELRKIATQLPMSLKDLYNSCDAIWNLGMGIEAGGSGEVIRVEDVAFFYDDAVILQLKNVDNIVKEVAEDRYYSEAEFGYDKWEVEEVNSQDAFNTRHEYVQPLEVIDNKLSAVSPFIADAYPIEYTRRMRFESTKDWMYDDNGFIVATNRSVDGGGNPDMLDILEKDENFTTVNNVISPSTIINLRFSPKRNLFRWVKILGSSLLLKPGTDIQFTFSEGSSDAETAQVDDNCPGAFSGATIREDDNLQWDDPNLEDGTPIWKPFIYKFTAPLTFDEFVLIKASPRGVIEFSSGDTVFIKGYILEIDFKIGNNKADFVLLEKNV